MVEVMMLGRSQIIGNLDLLEEIQRNNTREQEVQQTLKKGDGITYLDGQIYIPNNRKIKEQILQENHDPVDVSHLG